jgi:hypothetical protein
VTEGKERKDGTRGRKKESERGTSFKFDETTELTLVGHACKIGRNDRRAQLLDIDQQLQAPNSG